MKTCTSRFLRPATVLPGSFALHPLSLACLLALAGPAFALPQGAAVVNGQVKIGTPTATQQVLTQASQKAIVDWTSFSIAAGEKVRFDQPSSSAVILNRVTGVDPSRIFGQMEANGRVFLLNPYGVVFGASARVDVAGLVAASLSLSNADFTTGRLRLSSNESGAPAQRGEVRNEGIISAPGGSVVLAAPKVANTGSIEARGGRVGMAAAQDVLVDVEGDGLILFQASATEAGNRLAQLGRIQADGGSVELRAAARGAFADTVLNMTGVVQARTFGTRAGHVVIDAGDAGITRVAGRIDTSGAGAGESGGRITVSGQKVLLDDGAALNASGDAGGGTVLAGGDWQGRGPAANAQMTHVARGARIDASATGNGNGGTAVVWSDESTRFYGDIAARGGAQGGDGGKVEVSGKHHLDFAGSVSTLAAHGRSGSLLLDPSDITIGVDNDSGIDASNPPAPFTIVGTAASSNLKVGTLTGLLGTGDVTVDATVGGAGTGSISVETEVAWNSIHSLTLTAASTISSDTGGAIRNAGTGGLHLKADGAITLNGAVTLAGGSFTVAGTAGAATRAASFTAGAITTTGGAGVAGGAVTIATNGDMSTGVITTRGGAGSNTAGRGLPGGVGSNGGTVLLRAASNGAISTAGIDASGGAGGSGGPAGGVDSAGNGGSGGNAGTITVESFGATRGIVASGSLAAQGGVGGSAGIGSGGQGGSGGSGNSVTVDSDAGSVGVTDVTSRGGLVGTGDAGGAVGTNASIALTAGTGLTVAGALNTGGGPGTTIGLNFGQAGGASTLDLGSAGNLTANAISATGGGGADTLVFTSNAATTTLANALLTSGATSIALASIETATLSGGPGANTIDASAWTGGRTATIRPGGGADSITGNGTGTTLVGTNAGSTYNVTGPDGGNVDATATFIAVGNLTGGSGADAFNFTAATSALSGNLVGGGGSNSLSLAGLGAAIAIRIDQQAGTATGIGGTFANINAVTGNGANTTLVGTTAGQAYTITGANAGTAGTLAFSGVGSLIAGAGDDSFSFTTSGGSLAGTLDGGGGTNTLDLGGLGSGTTIAIDQQAGTATGIGGTFSGIGTINGNGANTTITGLAAGQTFRISDADAGSAGTLGFTNVGSLTGGAGNDNFVFGPNGGLSGSLAGGGGNNTLDLGARNGTLTVNLQAGMATPIAGTIAGITSLVGNGAGTTLVGRNAGQVFTLTNPDKGMVDTFGFDAVGSLVGGSGADTFTATGTGSLSGSLTDTGGTTTLNGILQTVRGQSYAGNVTLGSDTALNSTGGQAIDVGGTIDGAHALAIATRGLTTLGGAVGSGTALDSVTIAAGGGTTINGGAVTTTGAQSYGSAVTAATLSLTSTAAGGHITASNGGNDFGTVSLATTGATDVTLVDANSLALGTVIMGNGANTITAGPAVGSRLSRGGTLAAGTAPILTVGGVALNASVSDFFIGGAASSVEVQAAAGGAHNLIAAGVAQLPGLNVTGSLALTASGAVTQNGVLHVDGSTAVSAGANAILLNNPGNDFTGAVTLSNSGAGNVVLRDANALQLGTLALGSGTLDIIAAGNITQTGPITVLPGAGTMSITAGAGDVILTQAGNDFATLSLAGSALAVTVANNLSVTTLSAAPNRSVSLIAGNTLVLPAGGINTGTGDLTLASNAGVLATNGALAGRSVALTGAGGIALGGNVTSSADQVLAGPVTLTTDAALNAGAGHLALQGAVDGGGHNLALASTNAAADAIRTGAAIANTAQFSATGNTTLGGNVTSSGNQTYSAGLALAADAALNAGAGLLALQGTVDGGGHNLALASTNAAADAIRTGAAVANNAQFSATGNTTLGGNVTSSGNQTYGGPVKLTVATTLTGVDLNLLGTVDGGQSLTLAGSGTTTLAAAIGGSAALASLADDGVGATRIGSNVTTTGTQTWGDALTLTGTSTMSGSTLTFGGSVNGAQALTVTVSGSMAVFNAAVGDTDALASLNVNGPALLNGGNITTTGSQTYANAVTLGSNTVLAGQSINFLGAVDGARALAVQNPGNTLFAGAVGAGTALASLAIQGGGPVSLTGPSIDTTGAQSYSGSLKVNGNTRLAGSSLGFGANVSGAQDLQLQTDTLNVAGTIGGTGTLSIAPLTAGRSIGVAGAAGDLQVPQALLDGAAGFAQHTIGRSDGSGDITAGALQLRANTTLQTGSGSVDLQGAVDGGFDLTLNAGGVTHIAGPVGATTALRSLSTDNSTAAADWDASTGERTLVDTVDASGRARIITTGAQTYNDPLVVSVPLQLDGGMITAAQPASRFDGPVHSTATQLDLRSGTAIRLGDVTLAGGGRIETDGLLEVSGALALRGGTLSLISNATPTSIGFTDPDLQGRTLNFGLAPVTEASATLFQSAGSTISSAAGSLLVLRSPNGGSLQFENTGNDLLGGISAVSGPLGDNSASRFAALPLGFVRIASTEINTVGAPPADGSQTLLQAGIEGDVLKLSADKLTTGATGLLRARLPFDNSQGSATSIPGMTLMMSPTALTIGGGFGLAAPDGFIQVRVGSEIGGFLTVRPRSASGDNAFVLLAGPDPKPFYDGNGKLTEVRVFYNGDVPRTPQESGALAAVTAIVEDARQTRFEEAVRTENVKSRLRSGVIAEVGAGRPATVGRESIRLPLNCNPKPGSLECE